MNKEDNIDAIKFYVKQKQIDEIRKISEEEVDKGTFDTNDDMEFANIVVKERFSKVLQIIDKAIGDNKK